VTRSKHEAELAVAAVLDGARELAERHGVVLAIGASASFADRTEIGVASVGDPEDALDVAAVAAGALMGPAQRRPGAGALKEAFGWGLERSAGLIRKKVA
jgi:polysaccharide deacetylase 2 family uncharacterized protein YibQ